MNLRVVVRELVIAIVAGVTQGVVEWLPVSSQGNVSLLLTVVGEDPAVALQFALFLQLGTTLSAASYYRSDIRQVVKTAPGWRPQRAFDAENALLSYIAVASLCTGVVGIPLYLFAVDVASELTGGTFVLLIGVLLLITGVVQIASESAALGVKRRPNLLDSVVIGAFQGLTILPGISRSGTTTSVLLFRNYEPAVALRLSFLLSIPASLGGAAITLLGAGGIPGISPVAAVIALGTSAIVGFVSIDVMIRTVERIPFWAVCFGLGGIALIGGILLIFT